MICRRQFTPTLPIRLGENWATGIIFRISSLCYRQVVCQLILILLATTVSLLYHKTLYSPKVIRWSEQSKKVQSHSATASERYRAFRSLPKALPKLGITVLRRGKYCVRHFVHNMQCNVLDDTIRIALILQRVTILL